MEASNSLLHSPATKNLQLINICTKNQLHRKATKSDLIIRVKKTSLQSLK